MQTAPVVTQAPVQSAPVNGNTVISSPAPTVVYTQPAPAPTVVYTQPAPPPVVVQQEPVVTYIEPRPRVSFSFDFGHLFGHHHGGILGITAVIGVVIMEGIGAGMADTMAVATTVITVDDIIKRGARKA